MTHPIITKRLAEFDELIGPPPAILEYYKDKLCFVCGQPFNKSPQVDSLKAFFFQAMTEIYEAGKKDEFQLWIKENDFVRRTPA